MVKPTELFKVILDIGEIEDLLKKMKKKSVNEAIVAMYNYEGEPASCAVSLRPLDGECVSPTYRIYTKVETQESAA
jgi:hypothetical protein